MTRLLVRGNALIGLRAKQIRRELLPIIDEKPRSFSKIPDPSLLDVSKAPAVWKPESVAVYPDMVTEEQAQAISDELLSKRMRRRRYEQGHWDSVITHYREIELLDLHELLLQGRQEELPIAKALGDIQRHLHQNHGTPTTKWLPCHAIDLRKDGELRAHVDSVRFSGHIVAGLSLLSPAIMRLRPKEEDQQQQQQQEEEGAEEEGFVDIFLPPKSLYVLTGIGRYETSHELLPDGSMFRNKAVNRDQRLSIIFRDAKDL
eukprot:CAMPEP_0116110188 /NCGR_PEP_ID=MMETSP0327-20121206/17771_1 /TAXON_ID=44447 /ORGANISM="Pseudo-nitzschia delicatissima, Strain B596" /LENGTH=259 /DNA_ID=CAMNT_0003603321 /DNA_START=80 /DNA_END=859 /DNA_ORIENTATION=+